MATSARFGRLPRTAPSLTSTIVALAEQYQNMQDRNIEDAWKNGGLFEGKKVTDQMFLKHWKERLAAVDESDPMWDYYNNQIYQYEFLIAETKMAQDYAEEDVGELQMAAFYRKWAAKMPPNSQNYRLLMTQAAKFKQAAAAKSSGRSSDAAAAAYQRKQQHTFDTMEKPFDQVQDLITYLAYKRGYLTYKEYTSKDQGWSALTTASGENDPANFADLMSDIQSRTLVSRPGEDDMALVDGVMSKVDPNWDGTLSEESIGRLARNARNGANQRHGRAIKIGDSKGATAAAEDANKYGTANFVTRAILGNNSEVGFIEENEARRGMYDIIAGPDSGASPTDVAAAAQSYSNWLATDATALIQRSYPPGTFDPTHKNHDVQAVGLLARVNASISTFNGDTKGGLNLKDDPFNFSKAEAGAESDTYKTGADLNLLFTALDSVAQGESIIVRTDGHGKPTPDGSSLEVLDRRNPALGGKTLVPTSHMTSGVGARTRVVGPDGKPIMVGGKGGEVTYLVAQPITIRVGVGADPATGRIGRDAYIENDKGTDAEVGVKVTENVGGTTKERWGVWVNGRMVWTAVNPFAAGGSETPQADGSITLTYTRPLMAGQKDTFNPQDYVDSHTVTDFGDGKGNMGSAFNTYKEADTYGSAADMRRAQYEDPESYKKGIEAYYEQPERWTPQMQADFNNPNSPNYQNPTAVVKDESRKALNTVQFYNYYGYTPEMRTTTMNAMQQRGLLTAAANEARRRGDPNADINALAGRMSEDMKEGAARTDLLKKSEDWAAGERKRLGDEAKLTGDAMGIPQSDVDGGINKYTGFDTRGYGGHYTPPAADIDSIPKGWTISQLLNQPGMSMEQANALVYKITKGAHGSLPSFTVKSGSSGQMVTQPNRQYVNPYEPDKPFGQFTPAQPKPAVAKPNPIGTSVRKDFGHVEDVAKQKELEQRGLVGYTQYGRRVQ